MGEGALRDLLGLGKAAAPAGSLGESATCARKAEVVAELLEDTDCLGGDLAELGSRIRRRQAPSGAAVEPRVPLDAPVADGDRGFERVGEQLLGMSEVPRRPERPAQLPQEQRPREVVHAPEVDGPAEQVDRCRHVRAEESPSAGRTRQSRAASGSTPTSCIWIDP